jgi:hypothetical protein
MKCLGLSGWSDALPLFRSILLGILVLWQTLKEGCRDAVKLRGFHHLARRNRLMLDLIVVVVTVVSFVLLIGFTVGCDRL